MFSHTHDLSGWVFIYVVFTGICWAQNYSRKLYSCRLLSRCYRIRKVKYVEEVPVVYGSEKHYCSMFITVYLNGSNLYLSCGWELVGSNAMIYRKVYRLWHANIVGSTCHLFIYKIVTTVKFLVKLKSHAP